MTTTSSIALSSPAVYGGAWPDTNQESDPTWEETHGDTNHLPFELERYVCEIAMSSYPKCTAQILRVARRFHRWFEPELYRVLRSGEDNIIIPPFLYKHHPKGLHTSTSSFSSAPLRLNTTRLDHYGPWVRHILLQNRPSAEIAQILAACPSVSNLALWIVHGECTKEILPVLAGAGDGSEELAARAPLRRLSFDPSYFFTDYSSTSPIPFASPVPVPITQSTSSSPTQTLSPTSTTLPSPFLSLTHLEIINATPTWSKWSQLTLLPCLTHLGLTGVLVVRGSSPVLPARVLDGCLRLEVFVIFDLDRGFVGPRVGAGVTPVTNGLGDGSDDSDSDEEDLDAWKNDTRVVLLDSAKDHLDHWELGARGGRDFWVIAEEMRDARRARRRLGLKTPSPPVSPVTSNSP